MKKLKMRKVNSEVDWWESWYILYGWWYDGLMRKLIDEKVDGWKSWLMRKLIDEKFDWWESWWDGDERDGIMICWP